MLHRSKHPPWGGRVLAFLTKCRGDGVFVRYAEVSNRLRRQDGPEYSGTPAAPDWQFFASSRRDSDLTNNHTVVNYLVQDQPDLVIHAAAMGAILDRLLNYINPIRAN